MKSTSRKALRQARHRRIRRKVIGTASRPRMAIAVSGRNIQVQFIDDEAAKTLASATTLGKENKKNMQAATAVGKRAAEAAGGAKIEKVVVDRGGHKFHGRVKAVVDAVAEAGLVDRKMDKEAK